MNSDYRYIAEEVRRDVEGLLSGVGLLFRVFCRGKDRFSLNEKIDRDPGKYSLSGKLVQDVIGIRVALYFPDDIAIVKSILESKYGIDATASTIDKPDSDEFSVTRYNLVFRLPSEQADSFARICGSAPLDSTFEVQLRSILSEGWHEVEHDLRYKAKSDWNGHDDLSRVLNAIVATLETSEWSMGKIFDELAYRHYKARNWNGMLPSLLRMRLRGSLSEEISRALNSDPKAAKDLSRINRSRLLIKLSNTKPKIPITLDNVVFAWNLWGPRHQCLVDLTPQIIQEAASEL